MSAQDRQTFSPEKIAEFCRCTGCQPEQVALRTNGAHRDALIAPDRVYFFPRTAPYAAAMLHEMKFLKEIGGCDGVPMPRFVDLIQVPSVFAGEIGVVSLLAGGNWEDIQESFSWEFIDEVLKELVELFVCWHDTPPAAVPHVASAPPAQKFSEIPRMQAWLAGSLDPKASAATVTGLHAEIIKVATELAVDPSPIQDERTLQIWVETVGLLAAMSPVLLHGDIHEGQILLNPQSPGKKITGILDWEAVQYGNALMDFSYHKWGWGRIWVFRDQFPVLRRKLWGRYLSRRGISNISPDGLHLYCSLTEMFRTILESQKPTRPRAVVTRTPFAEAMAEQLGTLRTASQRL